MMIVVIVPVMVLMMMVNRSSKSKSNSAISDGDIAVDAVDAAKVTPIVL